HQVRVKSEDVPKTAFNTRYGKFEFLVLSFGLSNSPPVFQTMMNSVLRPFLDNFVIVYLDDILVFSKTLEEHKEHIRLVLNALKENKLVVNAKKCEFGRRNITFVGHIVGERGIAVDSAKIDVIRTWPVPSSIHEIRQFLGLCSYYRRFIAGFADIAAPLTDL